MRRAESTATERVVKHPVRLRAGRLLLEMPGESVYVCWARVPVIVFCASEACIETLVEDAVRRPLLRNVSVDAGPLHLLTGRQ